MDKADVLSRLNIKSYYLSEIPSLKSNGSGMGQGLCPFHEDHRPSLSVNLNTGQFKCFSCDKKGSVFDFHMSRHGVNFRDALNELSKRAGITPEPQKKIVKTYNYTDESGKLLFQVLRYEPKSFSQRRPDGRGGWIYNLQDVRLVPYNLPELLKAEEIFICEGEKDAENLKALGLTATCNPHGAGKWRSGFNQYFKGKGVVILPDNDPQGKNHAQTVAKNLRGIAGSVKVVDAILEGLPEKGDISDWLERGGIKERLLEMIANTPEWTSEEKTSEQKHHFSLIQAKDLLSIEESETGWLWDGILPIGGLSLLVAKPKVGKTTLAFNLAVAVSRGDDFLGRKTQKADVVYLALEEKRGELQKKLKALGITEENLYFHFGPAPIGAIREVEPLIKDTKAKLLVIDVLQKFVRVRDLNDYAQVTRALEPLMAVARQENCHILMTHHAGKTDRPDGDDILGSTGLLGGVDTSIHLKKKDQRRTLFTIQRYGEDFPETVITLLSDGSLEARGSREEVEVEEAIPLILEVLKDGSLTEKDIWDQVEKGHSLVSKALKKLVERGEIRRSGSGKRGDPYLYEKKALLLSSVYVGESRREMKSEGNPLKTKGLFSPDDFQDFQENEYPSGENQESILGQSACAGEPHADRKEVKNKVDLDLEKEEVKIVE